jgi:hypothetical protein
MNANHLRRAAGSDIAAAQVLATKVMQFRSRSLRLALGSSSVE